MTRPADYQKYRSERQIVRILDAVAVGPMTAKQLAAHVNLTVSGILIYTRLLMDAPRRMHIAAYQHAPTGRGRPGPMYAAGDQPDVKFVPVRQPKLSPLPRLEMQRERVLVAMAEPCTAEELGKRVFLTQSRARFYVRELRLAKLAYICAWAPAAGQGDIAPIYALGSKRDKKKPRKTRAQRYKAEMANEERRERIQNLRKTRENLARALRKPTHWASALGAP